MDGCVILISEVCYTMMLVTLPQRASHLPALNVETQCPNILSWHLLLFLALCHLDGCLSTATEKLLNKYFGKGDSLGFHFNWKSNDYEMKSVFKFQTRFPLNWGYSDLAPHLGDRGNSWSLWRFNLRIHGPIQKTPLQPSSDQQGNDRSWYSRVPERGKM